MVIHGIRWLLLALFTLMAPLTFAVTAEVDRNHISLDETVTLTITVDGASLFGQPDLSPLERNFDVLNTQRRTQIINGDATTQWIIPMSPKSEGQLRIPSLKVGSDRTPEISITVDKNVDKTGGANNGKNSGTAGGNERNSMWMTAEVEKPSVYVQQQAIVTIKIGSAIDLLEAPQIQKPDISNAPLEVLNNTQYRKRINGTLYTVFEIRCALFPGQSGALVIPSFVADVIVPQQVRQNSSMFFQQFMNQGRRVRLKTDPIDLDVKEKPASFPANAPWIIAESLTASETWSDDPQKLQTGGSITRSVTLQARGALAEQIPALPTFALDGFKLYPDQAKTDKQVEADAITGSRVESVAMLPTRPGDFAIPEIRIPWWNSKTDQLEYATVPAISLKVSGASMTAPTPVPALPTPDTNAASPKTAPTATAQIATVTSPLWMWISAALAASWLLTLLLWWWKSRPRTATTTTNDENALRESAAWQTVVTACKGNDLHATRNALLALAQSWFTHESRTGLKAFTSLGDAELQRQLDLLDQQLYGANAKLNSAESTAGAQTSARFDGLALLARLKTFRGKPTSRNAAEPLPPLYPTSG